jgi:hypothetical protein
MPDSCIEIVHLPLAFGLLLPLGGCASLIRATAFHPSQVLFKFFAPRVALSLAFLSGTSLIRSLLFYCSHVLRELFAACARRLACLALSTNFLV